MARRTNLKRVPRKRYKLDKAQPPIRPIVNVTGVVHQVTTTNIQITFDQPVIYQGTTPPQSWTFKGQKPTAYVSQTPTSCIVAVASAVVAADPYVIGNFDPAVRSVAGGFVNGTSGAVS